MKKIVIAGGGISGLSLAYLLINRDPDLEITVYEADGRAGGKIWTDQADGYLCEKGPNGFLDNKPKTIELCSSLGIDPVRSNENSKKRFLFSDKRLKELPVSPPAFLKSDVLSWGGKLRMLGELVAKKGPEDETVADFIIRRLGREALDKLIDPMCSGIYAGNPHSMSIKNCFPRIKELEQEYGSLIRALIKISREKKREKASVGKQGDSGVSTAPGGTLTSFYDGAQTITDALSEKLGDRIRLGVSVDSIQRDNGSFIVKTSGQDANADIVVLASPAYASAAALQDIDHELAAALSDIPYPHVAVVCFGYRREHVAHTLNGFGFLIPSIEKRNILGSLWDSSIFPNRASEGHVLLRSMMGGARAPEMADYEDDKLMDMVFEELKPVLGLRSDPEMARVYRWEKAIPQYMLGHTGILQRIDERLSRYPGLYLTGNAYRGIGINDCIENSYKLADVILNRV